MKSANNSLVLILLSLILSTTALHSSCAMSGYQPAMLWLALDALNLPSYQPPEAIVGRNQDSCVLIIEDFEGRLIAEAVWDGSAPRKSAGGEEWIFDLSAMLEGHKVEYELGIRIGNWVTTPGSSAVLTVRNISGFKFDTDYKYILKLYGFDCIVSDNGRLAALSPNGISSDGLCTYLVAITQLDRGYFQLERTPRTDEEPCFILAESERSDVKGLDGPNLIEILFLTAQSWASEHVLSYAHSIEKAEKVPDIRILGVSDKTAIRPGEIVRYTYFLFNAGAGSAADVELTIPISAEAFIIPESIKGRKGSLDSVKQEAAIQVHSPDGGVIGLGMEQKTIRILLTEDVFPGEAVIIEFSVSV